MNNEKEKSTHQLSEFGCFPVSHSPYDRDNTQLDQIPKRSRRLVQINPGRGLTYPVDESNSMNRLSL